MQLHISLYFKAKLMAFKFTFLWQKRNQVTPSKLS